MKCSDCNKDIKQEDPYCHECIEFKHDLNFIALCVVLGMCGLAIVISFLWGVV